MEQLRRYAIFAAVVEAGSMTGAAKSLGMTPSAVSQHISQLENLLGLTLLHRSTRRLSLTEAGEVVWQGCRALQQTLSETELRLSEVRDSLLGELPCAVLHAVQYNPRWTYTTHLVTNTYNAQNALSVRTTRIAATYSSA